MIPVLDYDGILTDPQKQQLGRFIIDKCRSRIEDIEWIKNIKLRNDGITGYLGYWTSRYRRVDNRKTDFTTVIVLNTAYLTTVEQMEQTLAHEYGHNWTLGYLTTQGRINSWDAHRSPWRYYRIRRMDSNNFCTDYNQGWQQCDKEVLAEDYRCLFTPFKDEHAMERAIGCPSTEVKDYLNRFGSPLGS